MKTTFSMDVQHAAAHLTLGLEQKLKMFRREERPDIRLEIAEAMMDEVDKYREQLKNSLTKFSE